MAEEPLSIVLFSGTDDKLSAAATLTAGAAALGKPVHIFLQYWGLAAFGKGRNGHGFGYPLEAGADGRAAERWAGAHEARWIDVFTQAKEIGDVSINACAQSMEMFGLAKEDLADIVDGVHGIATFMLDATGQIVFI